MSWIRINNTRRINFSHIREYKPTEKNSIDKIIYSILITYSNGDREDISFGINETSRDETLKIFDQKA